MKGYTVNQDGEETKLLMNLQKHGCFIKTNQKGVCLNVWVDVAIILPLKPFRGKNSRNLQMSV